MKIKKVSTEQFAGIREREISFDEGINVVYGKNESGKSTLANLISRTLFQDAKINKGKKTDKEFALRYFPCETKTSAARTDYIHGKLVFEANGEEYVLTKEWGEDPVCKLSAPSGMIKNQAEINSELEKALGYGEGVYSGMLFSSQYNTDASLREILDFSETADMKKELADVVTKLFSESDGISAEEMENAINKKIEDLEGKHWDRESGAPVRRAARWTKEIGEVHKAYHDYLDAKGNVDNISELEKSVFEAEAAFGKAKEAKQKAEKNHSDFSGFSGLLAAMEERRKSLSRLKADLSKYNADSKKWPETAKKLETAKILEKEQKNSETARKYNEAKPVFESINAFKKKLSEMRCPSEEDISEAKKAGRNIEILKNRLCGINLSAAIKMFGGNSIEIKSLVTGENLYDGKENFAIREAVSVKIPGVMEMQLAPADVDFEKTERELLENKAQLSRIFIKYGVSDIDALEKLKDDFKETENLIRTDESRLERITGFVPFDEIEREAKEISGEIRKPEEIESDICRICGYEDIRSFITKSEVAADSFRNEYGSPEKLSDMISDCVKTAEDYEKSEKEAENIPQEYLGISDPQEHLKMLRHEMDSAGMIYEKAHGERTAAVTKLEDYIGEHPDTKEAAENAERKFREKKQLLDHWINIKKVFDKVREEFRGNPMEELSEKFVENLGIISGERISSEFPDKEKLDMNIYSGNSRLDYEKLSEGTKETVSLAFRLAVLDHLFPEGGVVVFDDPFTDMDAERTAKSCELIKKCAEKHQVIFLTCSEDYKKMLGGKIIDM